ncbi:MAG: DNA polymerase [Betaproteobacteria bacterium]
MDIITSDAETYWAADYSLSRMSPLEYVLSPHFELICLSLKVNDGPTKVHFGLPQIKRALAEIDFSRAMLLGHNMSGFDSYIFAYRLGIRPRMWGCTMAMAGPLHAKTTGVSLAKLVEHYGLGVKNNRVLLQTKGKRLKDFTPDELRDMRAYNTEDTDQCYELFKCLRPSYSAYELWQIDCVTRMRAEPVFELDFPLLEQALSVERSNKLKSLLQLATLLTNAGAEGEWNAHDDAGTAEYVRKNLSSQPQFSALLEKLGVPVPMKPSPGDPDKMIPALAKKDEGFVALLESENELVAAAARARLSAKSTLVETRIEKVVTAGKLASGRLPIPLKYSGAYTTGRDSGEEYNPQNFPSVRSGKPKPGDALRRSLRAPDGYKVVVADLSGIELRVNHSLWKVPYSTKLWRENPTADIYRASYAIKLGRTPEEITKEQREASKRENLGLGFGMGAKKYYVKAREDDLDITEEQAAADVADWRMRHIEIVKGWKTCHDSLRAIHKGVVRPIDPWGLTKTHPEGIVLPNGRLIRYPHLREEPVKKVSADGEEYISQEWWYALGRHRARIYGPKVGENLVQALARDIIMERCIDFFRWTVAERIPDTLRSTIGLRPALRVHDELAYVVPEALAQMLLDKLQSLLRTPLAWWPELVVWSEGDLADCYGDAK